jgi:hypothetical protein
MANLAGAAPVVLALPDDEPARALYLLLNTNRSSKADRRLRG